MNTYSAYKVNLNGSLSNRENINHDELDSWINSVYGKFASIRVFVDLSGVFVDYTDNGVEYVKI